MFCNILLIQYERIASESDYVGCGQIQEQARVVIKNKTPKEFLFLQCSHFIKIMNTLPEEKYARNQRHRKQEYYPQTTEQHPEYNTRSRHIQPKDSYRAEADNNQFYQSRQSYPESSYDNEGLLPPIRTQNKQNGKLQALAMRLRGQEDKTQIYLKNCEYIIKNLRELKHKKEKNHYLTMSTEPTPNDELQRDYSSKQDMQYYPKNQQFSSHGKPYNKLYPVEPGQKYKGNLKKLDDDFYKSYQYETPNVRVKSLPRKAIKNITMNKYDVDSNQDRNYYRSERGADNDQSDIPSGFDNRKREPRQQRRFSSSKNSERSTPRITKKLESRVRQVQKEDKQQRQRQQKQDQNLKVQRELVSCLSELTHFLRNQNSNKESIKQPTKEKTQQKPTGQNKDIVQPKYNHEIIEQLQPKSAVRNSKMEEKDNNQKADTLKEQAIVALKKLNAKSKGLVDIATNYNQHPTTKEQAQPQVAKKRSSVKFIEQIEHTSAKQNQANPQKIQQQKTIKPIIWIPANLKTPQNQSPRTSRQPSPITKLDELTQSKDGMQRQNRKQPKKQSLNSELAKQLVSYLAKQQNQNIELSFCLKELTQFLKIQNDQMELKTSRPQQQKPMRKTLSPHRQTIEPQEIPEEDQQQQAVQNGRTNKLQQAVIKKLKKARLRGNNFKQKVENFRKSHHHIIIKKQPREKQSQSEVQIKPVTDTSNTGSNQPAKDGEQNEPSPVNMQKQVGVQDTKS